MDKTKSIEIDVDEIGRGKVVINGQDISDLVDGFSLTAKVGEVTRCEVSFMAHAVSLNGYASVQSVIDEFNKIEQDQVEGGSNL